MPPRGPAMSKSIVSGLFLVDRHLGKITDRRGLDEEAVVLAVQ